MVRKVTRPVTPPVAESAEATATHDERSKDDRASTSEQTPRRRSGPIFTADDKANLLDAAENIMSETPSKRLASWSEFAKTVGLHLHLRIPLHKIRLANNVPADR